MRVAILLISVLLSPAAGALTLREALDQAWARTPQGQALQAREAEFAARGRVLDVPWAGSPAATFGYRTDRLTQDKGAAEWEAELAMPVWLPGERSARRASLTAEREAQVAELLARRLELAGQLRESVWAAKLSESALALAQQRERAAQELEQDVARRLKAGEVARSDYNLARSDLLTAQSEHTDARIRLAQALQAYSALTGSQQLPDPAEEPASAAAPLDDHPLLSAQRHAIASAQAHLTQVARVRRDNPEVSVSSRWDRAGFDEAYVNVIGIRIRVPFSTAGRNQPVIASANTALVESQAEYARSRARLEQEIEQAQRELLSAESVLDLVRQKQVLTADNLELAQKAYTLGEFDMVSLLRVRAAAFQADQDLARQQTDVLRARARLNQARGVLP